MAGPKNVVEDLALSAAGIVVARQRLARSQWWPPHAMYEYQLQRARTMVRRAYEAVPYYRELFWSADFDPYRDLSDLSQLSAIPILAQATARARADTLVDPAVAPRAFELRTSGTTGNVFRSLVSREHWVMEQATVWRHWSWVGYRFRDRMAVLRSYIPGEGEPLWKHDRVRNFKFFSAYHLSTDNAVEYLRELIAWRPHVIRGYPSALALLAEVAIARGIELPPLKGVLTASETVLPRYRAAIEQAFNAPVFDWYGQGECTATLSECEAHMGLHVNSEYGICELLPDDDLPATERRIVATNLSNRAMPLIRYDTGDIAVLDKGGTPCSCGRTLPLVKAVRGRADDFLLSVSGFRIPSVNMYTLMYETPGVLAFQLIQNNIGELNVVLEVSHWTADREKSLRHELERRLGTGTEVQISTGGQFMTSGDGKRLAIVARAARAQAARPVS